jgi:hypothetical protein
MSEKMKLKDGVVVFDNPEDNEQEKFLVILDTDDENEYNNPPEFVFDNYQKMWDFVHMVLVYGEKDLKVIITKGDK